MKIKEFQHQPVKPDTYEASMALNQLMRIGKHAIKLHNMIDDAAEMESWVAKKIDLAGDYVKKVYNYTEGEKAGLYDDGGLTEDAGSLTDQQKKALDMVQAKYGNRVGGNGDSLPKGYMLMRLQTGVGTDGIDDDELEGVLMKYGYDSMYDAEQADDDFYDKIHNKEHLPITMNMIDALSNAMGSDFDNDEKLGDAYAYLYNRDNDGKTEMKKMPKGTGTMYGVKEDQTTNDVKAILDKHGIKSTDDIEYGSDAFSDLFDYFSSDPDEMPYGVQKARTGMPDEWIANRLIDLGLLKEDAGFNVDAWSNDKVKEFGPDLMRLAKGQPIEMPGYSSYGMELDDGRPDDDEENVAADESIGGEVTNAIRGHRDSLEKSKFSMADYDRVKPNRETIKYAQNIIKSPEFKKAYQSTESVSEDAGEGHMSKSTLYHTAKYAIALMDMIKPGDDLEGWVQSKLNKAADYLQGAYNYEEYQKLNPYREELDNNMIAKHSQIIQKNIDEILAKETELDDIDTKPGMMRILAKRVNEVEKKIAKENRKETNEDGHTDVPSAIRNCETIIEDAMQMKQKLETMQGELPSWMTQMIAVAASDLNSARDYLLNPTSESGIMYRAGVKKYGKKGMTAIQSAAGKGASHQEIGKIKDKYIKDAEELEEGLKDWARNTAMAGVVVAGLAGVGSINDAIDNSIPAIGAMETALEMAQDSGNDELAKMIEKDLSDAKIRLQSGKDLSTVTDLQTKYAKFIKTEGLAYESKLAIQLNQQLK